jgi:hypothetical protein
VRAEALLADLLDRSGGEGSVGESGDHGAGRAIGGAGQDEERRRGGEATFLGPQSR